MAVYYKTGLEEIPKTCMECECHYCRLPMKKSTYEPTVKVEWTKKRHPDCPLIILPDK